jgi:hypothetical protein
MRARLLPVLLIAATLTLVFWRTLFAKAGFCGGVVVAVLLDRLQHR